MHVSSPSSGVPSLGTALASVEPCSGTKALPSLIARHSLSAGGLKGSPGGNSPPGLLSVDSFESFSVTLPETESLGKNKIFELKNVKRMDIRTNLLYNKPAGE